MTSLTAGARRSGTPDGSAQGAKAEAAGLLHVYCRAAPAFIGAPLAEQVESSYGQLGALLADLDVSPGDLVTERIFSRDLGRDHGDIAAIRSAFYSSCGLEGEELPAASWTQQGPCREGRDFELQAYGAAPTGTESLDVEPVRAALPACGKVLRHGGDTHVYLSNLVAAGDTDSPFSRQCESMFARADSLLASQGLRFSNVVRTWLFLRDIGGDYGDLNSVRNGFFAHRGIARFPASTGIGGGTYPESRRCSMDLYALASEEPVDIEIMRADTLNEAVSYGAAFSRGLKVTRHDRAILYVSGTASIDDRGRVVCPGDAEGQLHRMFVNLESLLSSYGAHLGDLVTAVTYLRHPQYLDVFEDVCAQRSIPKGMPNSVVVADVCRPEWLCEIEATAICPA